MLMRRNKQASRRAVAAANLILWLVIACLVLAFPLSGCAGQSQGDAAMPVGGSAADNASMLDSGRASPAEPLTKSEPVQEDDGVTPSVKAALDEYETFMNQYCDFMEEYIGSGYSVNMMSNYSKFLSQYNKVSSKFRAIDTTTFTAADSAYYAEVVARTTERLSKIL